MLAKTNRSPVTNLELVHKFLVPNVNLKKNDEDFRRLVASEATRE